MKMLKKFGVVLFAALAFSSCVDKDADIKNFPDPDVDFTYCVDGDQYVLDFYVVSTIQFTNTSAKSGAVTWDFGDGTTSNESNPLHKYTAAGQYEVTLTIDGVGYRTYPLMIYDIVPTLTVASQSDDIIQFNKTEVDFALALPNPENKIVRYVWSFPEGTTDANGTALTTFEGYSDAQGNIEYPGKVKFSSIGSQKITISSYFDTEGENRRLEDAFLNVQVGMDVPAPTLYYAVRDGNIMAMKIVDSSTLPAGTKILPYDMGVKSGSNPFQIVFGEQASTDDDGNSTNEGWVYILDAGKQYYYVNDENGTLGDGLITAMKVDGTGVNTMITNVGQYAFNDPFQGYVYGNDLYYTDRNQGISRIDLTTRGAVQGQSGSLRDEYYATNQRIPYYGRGIAYGAISTGHLRDSKGTWWWGKNYNANGIFRFKESDIYATQTAAEAASLPYPIVLSGTKFKAFTIDEARGNLYVWILGTSQGFYVFPLPGDTDACDVSTATAKFLMDADPINTTADEGVYTTQMAVDDETGCVYFGFRASSTDTSGYGTGVMCYDPNTGTMKRYGETSDAILGITINPNKTLLF
ncbi:MAG: PKD domain-containing protein [Bacteroidales bacterium]|nr:PKD domain-containing protein [Bacteroidales bacterium]MCD8394818.1 PKD domain-containing protein [Bacteroidales bacterium]